MGCSVLRPASTLGLPVLVVTCTFLAGCRSSVDPNRAIVGTWQVGDTAEWVFNPDGTLVQRMLKDGKESEWTYKIIDGDKIDMAAKNDGHSVQSQYRFEGNDRLVILMGVQERPTRIGEAVGASEPRLHGKGGGIVVKLRRK